MKNRIIQYLAVNNGFDIFSIEAAMPESYKLNDYTVRGEGDPKKLIAGMYFWTWNTEEVLNMVEWMRRYNQPNQRIAFTGFDMQAYEGAIDELSGAFKENEDVINQISDLKKLLDEIKKRAQQSSYVTTVSNSERDELNSLFRFLQKNIEISTFQASDKNWLLQNIVVIQQCLQNYQSNNNPWRDKCMADNLMWIKEHNPDSKIVTWAHNGHIMKTDQMMGYHLAKMLGDDHVTFGFTFSEGSYTAAGNRGLTSYPAVKAYPGTLEFFLEQLNEPIFIIDLKKIISNNDKDTKWLMERLPYRRVGALGGQAIEFSDRKVVDDFDYLIFIKTSTPSTLLR
jgi:erythromycin esterase